MIIGFNGFRGAGKDTAGDYLVNNYGFQRLSFAAPLKQSVANLFGITLEQIEEWKNDDYIRVTIAQPEGWDTQKDLSDLMFIEHEYIENVSFRTFLQRYGTEAHRDVFGENFWVDQAMSQIEDGKNYVFTDARFENELMAIRQRRGLVVRIERDAVADEHRSEVVPPRWMIDRYLHNFKDIEFLHEQLDLLMQHCQISFLN